MYKKPFSLVSTIIFLSFHILLMSQDSGPFPDDLERLFNKENITLIQNNDKDFLRTWQEHIVLQTNRNELDSEEPLFFKAFILTGPERVRATLSKVLRIDLLDDKDQVLATQYHRIEDGMAQGAISVPKKMKEGNYLLRAYTQWMKNYGKDTYYERSFDYNGRGQKRNESGQENVEIHVAFYPEGGKLIADLENRLLLKTTNQDGTVLHVEGAIVDETESISIPIKTYFDGMSSVIFVPKAGKKYNFRTTNNESFALPEIKESGFAVNVSSLNPKNLMVRVQSSHELLGSNIFLRGVMDNVPYFEKELEVKTSSMTLDIPKEGIPQGVLEIQLVGQDNALLAKRPVEIGSNELNISITPMENKNAFTLRITDLEGKPVEADLSLGISQADSLDSIFLEKPTDREIGKNRPFKLQNKDRVTLFRKDLDIMTSQEILQQTKVEGLPNTIKYPFQRGLNLYGYAYNMDDELLTNTNIQIFGVSNGGVFTKEIMTDASGVLRLEDLQFEGETELVFRTNGDDTKSRLVRFEPKEDNINNADGSDEENRTKDKAFDKGDIVQSSAWEPVDSKRLIELEEVSVTEKKQSERKKTAPSVYGVIPTKVKYQDLETPQTIPQLFLGIPGVRVLGLGTIEPTVLLPRAAGMGQVLWVLDGMPLVQPTKLSEIISMVNYVDVDRIEILYGAQASIYGSRAGGGAIIIYTRSGSFLDSYNRKDANIKFQGYHDSLNFEKYLEELEKKSRRQQNNLNTLYWNPNLKTDDNGEIKVEFKSPIENVSFIKLEATAVTEKGEMGRLKVVY